MTVIILVTKFADRAIHNQDFLKSALSNSPILLVRDGVIDMAGASRRDLNTLEVMELLRIHGVRNLGAVEWAFMEAGGQVSVFLFDTPRPGLAIVPPLDLIPTAPSLPPPEAGEAASCYCCGLTRVFPPDAGTACPNCGRSHWVKAAGGQKANGRNWGE
nr:YetF domain-containing protein [Paracoccus amoyensis]